METSDKLNSDTCTPWSEVYKGLYNLRLMWVHLMEMKSFRALAKKAYPKELISLLVSFIQCKVASIQVPDLLADKERDLTLRMMTVTWNEAFRLMILICTNTKSSKHHIYTESVISSLTDHMKDQVSLLFFFGFVLRVLNRVMSSSLTSRRPQLGFWRF